MGIEKYLYNLFFAHECVIVPGFGGFIKNYQPASIQAATHVFNPPRQYLVFNSGLAINDGLVATHIAEKENISFGDAMKLIERDVTSWRERMRAGKKVTLLDIGIFSFNSEEKIVFEPDREVNFFSDAFGMNAFVAPPLATRAKRKTIAATQSKKRLRQPVASNIKVYLKAAAITIPLIAAGLWATMNQDTIRQYARQSASNIESIFERPANEFKPADNTLILSSQLQVADKEAVASEENTITETPQANSEPSLSTPPEAMSVDSPLVQPPAPAPTTGRYHVIVGSFANKINAQHLSQQYIDQGLNSSVIPSAEGRFRVSMTSCQAYQEALGFLNKLRSQTCPDAWLLRI